MILKHKQQTYKFTVWLRVHHFWWYQRNLVVKHTTKRAFPTFRQSIFLFYPCVFQLFYCTALYSAANKQAAVAAEYVPWKIHFHSRTNQCQVLGPFHNRTHHWQIVQVLLGHVAHQNIYFSPFHLWHYIFYPAVSSMHLL